MQAGGRHREQEARTRRTIARLLSLADMVERSACQFAFVRFFLLWLLRPVEQMICSYVIDLADDAGMPDLPYAYGLFDSAGLASTDSAANALNMALRLRMLAGLMTFLEAHDQAVRADYARFLRTYFRRHLRGLQRLAQSLSQMTIRAGQSAQSVLERPEVRPPPWTGVPGWAQPVRA